MLPAPLSHGAARRGLISLTDHLGRADQDRLAQLPPLMREDGRVPLDRVLAALYPGAERDAALTGLRQMRQRVSAAAREADIAFSLNVDTRTRSAPEQRTCWFAGDDQAAESAARLSAAETEGIKRSPQDAVELRKVRYFVSYAHDDAKLKSALLDRLWPYFDNASTYHFTRWHDHDIVLGAKWREEIQAAIDECDFGLLLVSPAFLASTFIRDNELAAFLGTAGRLGKPMAPVALEAFPFDGGLNLHGLEERQIFHDSRGHAFEQKAIRRTRNRFAGELFSKILLMLDRTKSPPPRKGALTDALPPDEHVILERRGKQDPFRWLREHLEHELDDAHHTPTHAHPHTLEKLETDPPAEQRREALSLLSAWFLDPAGQPIAALLGETGMGKTTTCKAFTHQLLTQRETDKTVPLPIYLDLRLLGEGAKAEPRVETVIETVLRRSWQGGRTEAPPAAEEIRRLVREEGAVIIFDGLDEVLIHLSERGGQQFTRELLSILPPAFWPRRRKPAQPGHPGRILLTCRTHYFRSVRDRAAHLTAEDRDDVRDSDYRVFMLLPFSDAQIRAYLTASLPGEDIDRVLETITSVHNLPEMAARPYTLSLITRALPRIERWKLEGRRVTGVDLYRHMVLSWLERDGGKHELEADHKQQMMEHVAARLHRSGGRTWTARAMEDWLTEFLDATPSVARHYRSKDLAVLKKDLRTATFLVGGGEAEFRFAHTSLQEFFLAGFLTRGLIEGRVQDWDMARPSTETLDFLGQMLLGESGEGGTMTTLRAIRDAYRPRVSELGFHYTLFALKRGYPAASPACVVLDGADLRDWVIEGPDDGALLHLRGASFRGARLANAALRRIDLDGANFSDADMLRAELNVGHARGACFAGAALTGTVFRDLDLTDAKFAAAVPYRTQFLRCTPPERLFVSGGPPRGLQAPWPSALGFDVISKQKPRLVSLGGHIGSVTACAFAPDGRTIASASSDKTIRTWDASTGEPRLTLRGHEGTVTACAFAPDGRTIASASYDNTIRTWDASTGEPRLTLRGHYDKVTECVFAPDGRTIASASIDNTIRTWDASTGEPRLRLRGHAHTVSACAFAPDGRTIASASFDTTIRTWDASTGEPRLTLRGHDGWVRACAFAPDGRTIASASSDNTIRTWDASTGEPRLTLRGHDGPVTACAFAPDGRIIASASSDNTIRIWDASTGEPRLRMRGHENWVTACAFAPDGRTIASASDDKTIRTWDASTGEPRLTLRGHDGWVRACVFAPDGRTIASASSDKTIRTWDASTGEPRLTLRGHENWVTAYAFAPDGLTIVSASSDNTIRTWDASTGEPRLTLRGHDCAVTAGAFAPDGRTIASASDDNTIRTWDASTGEPRLRLRGHLGPVTACAFAPDGRIIASASIDKAIRTWDASTGEPHLRLRGHAHTVSACAFAPDGRTIASASFDKTIRTWDASTGEPRLTLRGHDGWVRACAFAPDGRTIASASSDNTIRTWDASTGEPRLTLRGHDGPVTACAFAPDGRIIASASDDNTIRTWDASTGEPVGFRAMMFNGGEFASVTADGTRVIAVSPGAWRYLGWLVPDEAGELTLYPAEVFGPLPGLSG